LYFNVLQVNEDVAISLDPPSEAVTVSPSIVGPGSPIHLLVVDPQKIRSKGGEKLQLKALGLISGRQHDVPIEVRPAIGGSSAAQAVPPFEKENYDLVFENNFQEKELAIVKLESDPPAGTLLTLVGPLSERFTVTNQGQLVYVTANPCKDGCNTPKTFTLLLIATNQDSQQFTTLSFKTNNDGEFQFLDTPYSAILEEETGVFKKAVKVRTRGATGEVIYSLEDNTHLFSIHPKTGILTVQHPEFLTMNSHGSKTNLTVVANDKKTSVKTTIDVTLTPVAEGLNGFKFVKESYSFIVSPGQITVGEVTVADAGNHSLHYDIAEGGQGVLAIDDSGVLSYQGGPEKDSRNFSILVSAQTTKGQFMVATAWVDIAVQGINSYPVKVVGPTHRAGVLSASTKRGAKVASIEMTDADEDAAIQLSVEAVSGIYLNGSEAKGLSNEMFKTTMDGKTADLILADRIFDLPLASVTVQLRAQDHAHTAEPSVLVTQQFTIVRKHPLIVQEPVPFKFIEVPKSIQIPADSIVGSIIYTPTLLQSVISNATKYSFELESSSGAFSIENSTGVISTNRLLDGLIEDKLTVTVHDLSEENSAQVNLTVVITPARFQRTAFLEKQYKGKVKQSDPIGTPVLTVTAKSDQGGEIKLYDLKGSDAEFFSIDNRGVIRLKESVDNVAKPQLDFVATAGDGMGLSSVPFPIQRGHEGTLIQVRITIAKEDSGNLAFEKNSYEIKVMENTPLNGYVLHPQLVDGTQGPVEYSIETQNDATVIADLLEIDGNGRITVKEELQGYIGTYQFRVRATRGDQHAAADVIMHVLPAYRCVPSFVGNGNLEFSVEENMPPGTELGRVSAVELNPKCEVKFMLWDPVTHKYTNETKIASIDSSSGKIQTRISFDYEKQAMHPLILGLQAGAHQFAQMSSTIRVIDVDDHPLEAVLDMLTVEVPEDVPVGVVIATMRAIDLDKSQKIHYRLREQSKEFTVKPSTGEVVLISGLDRESKDSYSLQIGATNDENVHTNDITVWMTLKVIVTDVNDNGPLFEESRYNVLVSKNALPGEKILTVRAFDPDLPTPGNDMRTVFYKIKEMLFDYHGMNRNVENMFSVGQSTGLIRLEQTVR
ncbi:cadherin domain protein, partial [Oesophagostomum dentatum]